MKDRFFVYCNESGFDCFETLDDALDAANERTQGYPEDALSEEVTSVCVGKITHRAKMCDQVFPVGEIDEEGLDEAGEPWDPDWQYKCNYKILPIEHENPALDHLSDSVKMIVHPQPAPEVAKLVETLERLVFAAQCRDNSTGCQIRLIETRAELSAAVNNAEEALSAYRQQGGDV